MPMLFWLPAIVVSGWWLMLTEPSRHRVAGQSDDGAPPARPTTR
jgi:hypothetical protein